MTTPGGRPRSRHRRRIVAATVALVVPAVLLAWSGAVVVGAGSQRSIAVLCSSIEDLCREWAAAFTAASGVEVAMVRLSTGEALARLAREDVRFDVWHGGTAESFALAADRGLLAPYSSPEADAVPAEFRDPAGAWTGVYLGVLGFCSNTAELSRLGVGVPASWADLAAPGLAGQVSAPNPLTSGTGYTMVWTQRVRLGSDDAAFEFLARLDANVVQYTTSGMAPARVAGRGEAAVGVTFSQHCVKAHDEGLDDLVVTYPSEGTGFEVGAVALTRSGAADPAARAYVDFAISGEGQSLGAATRSLQLPTRPDVTADPRLGAGSLRLEYTPAQAAAAREQLTGRFVDEVLR